MQNTQGFKHTLGISNIYYFPRQQWLRERASILRYIYVLSLLQYRAVTFRDGTSN